MVFACFFYKKKGFEVKYHTCLEKETCKERSMNLSFYSISGKIRMVSKHHSQWIFTRSTTAEEAEEAASAAAEAKEADKAEKGGKGKKKAGKADKEEKAEK